MSMDGVSLPTGRLGGGFAGGEDGWSLDDEIGDGLVSVEGVALQYGMMPLELARPTCTADAENLLRLLGRAPHSANPWLPVSTLGPLLILAHHDPKSDDTWGVPGFLAVRVAISAEQYETLKRDLVGRVSARPIRETSPFEAMLRPPLAAGDLAGAFQWFLQNYPLPENQKAILQRTGKELLDRNPKPEAGDFNAIQQHLGVALQVVASGGRVLAFNPDEAPRQSVFPAALLERHGVYPAYIGRHRTYLLASETDIYQFEDEWLSGGHEPVEFVTVLADAAVIRRAVNRCQAQAEAYTVEIDANRYEVSDDSTLVEIQPEDVLGIDPGNPNNPPEMVLKWVLYQALQMRASDLHLEKYYNTVRFRARIDGELRVIFSASEEWLMRYVAILKNFANLGQSRQEAQDGRFGMAIGKRRIDVRVAAVPCRREFQKMILRFLDKDGGLKSLADLNLSQRQAKLFDQAMARDQGLILVTGPTGSGKTTTLYALLNSVNDDNLNLHTIEDPIEYRIEGINQTQTDPVHKITFATGLRALLRSDPDVILIGECRDEETAMAAVTSAMTGHLVLTTLHANDSLRAISRIISMGVPNYLLADSLVLSQAQRLVRRLCNYCKRPETLGEEQRVLLAEQGIAEVDPDVPVYRKVGCPECLNTGYKGRIALMEITEVNAEIKDLIAEGAPMAEVRAAAARHQVLSLYQEGLNQVVAGNTTFEEIRGLAY
jgi:type II secretory ATPase GspE/PulE/Tfp pilus assembly ATPase PilB-like protein